MLDIFLTAVAVIYFLAALAVVLYGLNCYVAVFLYLRREGAARRWREILRQRIGDVMSRNDAPMVTTQLPLFNEYNVAVRVMEAACAMRYPAGKHRVQVLDDSTDETRELVHRAARRLRREGHLIEVVRRSNRQGYKAGALAVGLDKTDSELVAMFDADFVPPPDYLLKTVPFFMDDPRLGLVQARWGHLNENQSLLTKSQSVGIDGHFLIEQSARAWNGLFMNFNGTAGVWRRQAIDDAGGWEWDTLTEDMDLSYRSQLAGWGRVYLPDVVVPAEIPEDVIAFKSQQFRWAKGSIQTARKILPRLWRAPVGWFAKLQALLHLTHYMVHPLMLILSILALPVLMSLQLTLGRAAYVVLGGGLCLAMAAPSFLYVVSQRAGYRKWRRRLVILPALVVIGVGVAVSNGKAVLEALMGRQSPFVRTPKQGDRPLKAYRVSLSGVVLVELALGLYCTVSLYFYLTAGKYLVGPFLGMYATGFLFIGLLSVAQRWARPARPWSRAMFPAKKKPMERTI
jgi:cellulose synthase/poly-beta-1,6-N-acetylglucosamine synthase-like glycosyltransferase